LAGVVIFDGNFMAHRARHTTGRFRNGISFGMLRSMHSVMKWMEQSECIWVFDGGLSSERLELLPEYKGTRGVGSELDGQMLSQLDWFCQGVECLGFPIIRAKGVEADDIIGLLAAKSAQEGLDVIIVSSDTDFHQLVSDKISCWNPISKQMTTKEDMVEKLKGHDPLKYVMVKSVTGDVADNIDGIKGVGWAGALKLLDLVETFDNLPHPDLSGRLSVINKPESISKLHRNYRLIHIPTEASHLNNETASEISLAVGYAMHKQSQNWQGFVGWLEKAQFKSVIKKIDEWEEKYKVRL
jgi:5'-3' exonuclease